MMFVGRKEELNELGLLWSKSTASLVTCRGRRRIGKSSLIDEFARRTADNFIFVEGLAPRKGLSDRRQRQHFCERLSVLAGRRIRAANWLEAFRRLDELIPTTGRTVLLLDEISWMGAYNPDFAGYLKEAWDRNLSRHDRLVVILCGSVSSWIAENILNSTGFAGRTSLDLELGELPFRECIRLMGPAAARLSPLEKIDCLSVTGGVPKYLLEIHPEYSVEENVRRMCFTQNGLLFREFDETFSGVFGRKSESRGKALRRLAARPLSVSEFAAETARTASGRLSRVLKELCLAGFVGRDAGLNPETGEPLRQERYRIRDNYTRFYLKYVEPNRMTIEQGLYRLASLDQLPDWEGLLGLQFESLVLNHCAEFFPLLGLDRSLVLSAAPYRKSGTKGEGLQIDLLVQTKRMVLVVEIKRRRYIPAGIVDEVREKVRRLRVSSDRTVRTALIYVGELAKTVEAEHYFDFVVDAAELFKEDVVS